MRNFYSITTVSLMLSSLRTWLLCKFTEAVLGWVDEGKRVPALSRHTYLVPNNVDIVDIKVTGPVGRVPGIGDRALWTVLGARFNDIVANE